MVCSKGTLMRAAVSVCVMFCVLFAAGCEQEPVNPAVEVLNNPPADVDLSRTREVKIEINGQDLSEGVTVRQGEPVQVTGTVDLDDSTFESPHVFGNVHIRMLPVGTEEDAWGLVELRDGMGHCGDEGVDVQWRGGCPARRVRSPRLHDHRRYAGRGADV